MPVPTVRRPSSTRSGQARRPWRTRILAVTGTAVAAVLATALPASASLWTSTDNFDQPSTWQKTVVGSGGASTTTVGVSGTDPGAGYFGEIYSKGSGFSSLGKTVHLTPAQFHSAQCGAQVYLRPTSAPVTVNVEVINPKSWTYLGLKQVKLPAWGSWQAVKVEPWVNSPADVYFRVSLLGDNATSYRTIDVDNLFLACSYS